VRSNSWTDRLIWQHAASVRSVASVQGDIVIDANVENASGPADYVGFEQYPHDDLKPIQLRWCSFPSAPNIFHFRHLGGFWWCVVRTPAGIQGIEIVVPHWGLALVILALPLGRALLRMKRRIIARWRQNSALCATCAYDLSATPDRCPECGRIPSASAIQSAT
jgi:hypothetical protein